MTYCSLETIKVWGKVQNEIMDLDEPQSWVFLLYQDVFCNRFPIVASLLKKVKRVQIRIMKYLR
jgi:hypothetical protein